MSLKTGRWYIICTLIIALTACSDDKDNGPAVSGIFVANEGNFGQGNASITSYNAEENELTQQAFEATNGRPLGDVANSITRIDDRLYIVVNNSHKIEVVDPEDLTSIGTISIPDDASPRSIVKAREGVAYVTNLYGNSVSVVNLEDQEVIKEIAVGENPEGIAVANGKAYVANSGLGSGKTLSVIDATSDQLLETKEVGDNPTDIVVDAADRIWVLCTGAYNDFNDPNDDTPGYLYVINSGTGTVAETIELGGHPSDLVISNREGKVFVLNTSIQIIRTSDLNIETTWTLDRSLYALGISDADDTYLYGTDPKNYAQQGLAIKYDMEGVPVDSFATGIIPGSFYIDVSK
jgi:YVTN family beta-propeller protein